MSLTRAADRVGLNRVGLKRVRLTRVMVTGVVAGLCALGAPAPVVAQAPATPARASDAYYEFLIARHLEAEGDNPGALAALERAAAADPQSAEVRAEIASFHMRRNQRAEAERAAQAAVALQEDNVEANRVLGLIAAANAENERSTPAQLAAATADAIKYLERASAGATGIADPNVNYTLGRLYQRIGQPEKAIQAFARVLAQNPNSYQGRIALAQAQAQMKDLQGAILTLEEVIDDEPRVAAALAQYQEQAGRLQEAIGTYTRALEVTPTSRALKARRVLALYQIEDFARAAAFAADAASQHPDDPQFPRLQASALEAAGDRAQAIVVLESALQRFPRDRSSQLALASLYGKANRRADEEKLLRGMLTANPDDADVLNFLGYMLASMNERLDEAIKLTTKAVEQEPDNGAFLDSLGWAHFRKGNLADAEKYLTSAAQKLSGSSEVLEHLGDLYVKRSRWSDAVTAYTKALAGDGSGSDRATLEKKITNAKSKVQNAK